jgi:hypothetical protein
MKRSKPPQKVMSTTPGKKEIAAEPATKPRLKRLRGARLRAVMAGLIPVPAGYLDPRS